MPSKLGDFFDTIKSETKDLFRSKKNLTSLLILGILILALPIGIKQLQRQQIIKSRADVEPIIFTGPNVKQKADKTWVATKPEISLQIASPLGPPTGASSTQTAQSKNPLLSFLTQGLVRTARAAECEPNTSAVCPDLGKCSNGDICATGHKYCVWDPDGNHYWSACQKEVDNCATQCNTTTPPSSNTCSVSWTIPNSPAANSSFKVSVKGESDLKNSQGQPYWDNVKWKLDGGAWNSITDPVTSGPTFSFTVPDAGAVGSIHILTFGSGNGTRICTPDGKFTTGGGSAGSCPADGNLTVTPKPAKVGETITFQYSSANGEDQWVGGDTWSGGVGSCTQDVGGRKYTCPAQSAVTNGTWNHYWGSTTPKQSCGSTTYTISGSGGPSGNSLSCTISGVKSVARGEKTTFTAASTDTRIRTMEIYYNYNDRGLGGDYHKVTTCNTDVTGLSGGCKGEVDTSVIPADKEGFTALCNAYAWKPREDGKDNCNAGNNDPIHCRPDEFADQATAMANACTGNPLWSTDRTFGWNGCGNSSHQEVALTAPITPPPPAVTTTKFRIAESLADFSDDDYSLQNPHGWQNYDLKVEQNPIDYTIEDTTPGVKTIFVQFKDSTGHISTTAECPGCQAQIKLLGDGPKITSCFLTFEGSNAIATLKGENFGSDKGKVKSGDKDMQVRDWKDKSVQVVWQNAPAGEALPVVLTNTDEQNGEGQCSAISQLSVGAKFFCGGPPPATVGDVGLVMAGAFEGGKLLKQTVSIDTKGTIVGLSQKLEEGKNYKLSLKAPRSLRKTVAFTAGGGTTNVSNFGLPLGDIFPKDGGDGTINALDKAELNRQWLIAGNAAGRSADFNGDGRVNSIDWACMRHDFGRSSDSEPVPGGPPAPSRPDSTASESASTQNLNVGSTVAQ